MSCLITQVRSLEEIDLYDTTLDKVAIIELAKGITLSKLKCLKIQSVQVFDGYIKILQLLKFNSSSLEEIYVGKCYKYELQTSTCCLLSIFESCNIVSESNKEVAFFLNILLEQNLKFDFLTHCKILDMTNCGIEDSLIIRITEDLKKSFSLEIIVLDYNGITGAGAASLASCLQCLSTLKHLSIACNLIDDSGAKALASVLCQCTSLVHLNLVGNRIGDEGAVAITEAVKDMNVELYLRNDKDIETGRWHLYYYCSRSTNLSFVSSNAVSLSRAIKCCTNLPSIEYYDSSNDVKQTNNLWKVLAEELQHLKNLSELKIHIWSEKLEKQTATALAESFKSCVNLQTLNIGENYFTTKTSAALIESLKNCNNLQVLAMSKSNLGLEGAAALAANLKSCTKLLELDIGQNNIGSKGAQVLATYLKSCTSLQRLDISFNKIGPEGAVALAEALKYCTNFRALSIRFNHIGPDGAAALGKHLKNCTQMLMLDITSNNIKLEGVAALQEGLKPCIHLQIRGINYQNY